MKISLLNTIHYILYRVPQLHLLSLVKVFNQAGENKNSDR